MVIQDDDILYCCISSEEDCKMSLNDFISACKEWLAKQEDYVMLEIQHFRKSTVIQLACNVTIHDMGSRRDTEVEAISEIVSKYMKSKDIITLVEVTSISDFKQEARRDNNDYK
jgi:uncharacterized protein with von Willebrand factor type A (vWA) domain